MSRGGPRPGAGRPRVKRPKPRPARTTISISLEAARHLDATRGKRSRAAQVERFARDLSLAQARIEALLQLVPPGLARDTATMILEAEA